MTRDLQIKRQWRLWTILASAKNPKTVKELAEYFLPDPINPRTIRRDLEVLRSIGAPLRTIKEGRTIKYAVLGKLPHLKLDLNALMALRIVVGRMRGFQGTEIGDALEQLTTYLQASSPKQTLDNFSQLAENLYVQDLAPKLSPHEHILRAIQSSFLNNKVISFSYRNFHGKRSKRNVHPQSIVYDSGHLYLQALDETRSMALRTFRLERIKNIKVLETERKIDPNHDPEQDLANSLGIFSSEHDLQKFRIAIHSSELRDYIQENPWHPSQIITQDPKENCWVLELHLSSTTELLLRVLASGPGLEALSPLSFRNLVAKKIHQAMKFYENKKERKKTSRSQSVRVGG